MDVTEIMAVLEEINAQDLNQLRQTRAISYFIAASAGFADENGKSIKRTIHEFWPLPGDIKETEAPNAEQFALNEQQAIKLAEILSNHGTKAI